MKTFVLASLLMGRILTTAGMGQPVRPDTTAPKQTQQRPLRATLPGYTLDPNRNNLARPDSAVYRVVPTWLRAKATGKPLYVIDGQVANANQLKNLKADAVESVVVTDGKRATALYGSVAREGLVAITTKAALRPRSH